MLRRTLILIAFLALCLVSKWHCLATNELPLNCREQPTENTCGTTCVQMVLEYYGTNISFDAVKMVCPPLVIGTLPDQIQNALRLFGVDSEIQQADLDDLKESIDNGNPVIVLVRSQRLAWHYVVVIGYNRRSIIVANPAHGNRMVVSNEDFERAWRFQGDLYGSKYDDDGIMDTIFDALDIKNLGIFSKKQATLADR